MSAEVKHVYVAINAVVAAISRDGIAKSRDNAQQGYKFRGIDDVYNALSSILAREKLLILPRVVERSSLERPTKNGGVATYTILTVEFDLVSAVDGSMHTIRTVGEAMDTADKSSNKAQSAAMKYACLMAFQIPTAADNDTENHHHEKAAPSMVQQLEDSIEVLAWEKTATAHLRACASLGDLQEHFHAIYKDGRARRMPEPTLKRVETVKNEMKKTLSQASANGAP